MSTYTETVVEERLRPTETLQPSHLIMKKSPPLMRTTSLQRIRQLPTYFCRQGSNEIHQWISSSRTKLYQVIADISQQLHRLLLALSVYVAVGILAIQAVTCLWAVLTNSLPIGLIFLVSCVIAMALLAFRTMPSGPNAVLHRSRSRTWRRKQD